MHNRCFGYVFATVVFANTFLGDRLSRRQFDRCCLERRCLEGKPLDLRRGDRHSQRCLERHGSPLMCGSGLLSKVDESSC